MTIGLPRQLDRGSVAHTRERTAVRLEQDLVLPAVDADPDRTPVGVDDHVERLHVRGGIGRLDVGEVTPSHRTGRAPELLGADAHAVVAEDGVPSGRHA
jgi:hypothetical protein